MPINLDSFRRVANTNQSNVRISDSNPDRVKTRGAIGAWFAAKINPDRLRTENTAVANAFLTALREDAAALPANLGQTKDPLKEEYRARLNDAIELVSSKLEAQRLGNAKLSSSDVRAAIRFIDEVKAEAIAEISIEEAEHLAAELSVANEALNPSKTSVGQITAGTILHKYLQGEAVSKEERQIANNFIPKAEALANKSAEAIRSLERTIPSDESAGNTHARRELARQLQEQGPALKIAGTLKWFTDADHKLEKFHAKVDATTIKLRSGDNVSATRNANQLVEAFHNGEKLSPNDLEFLKAWSSRESGIQDAFTTLKHHSELKHDLRHALTALYETHEFGLNQIGLTPYPEDQELEVTDLRTSEDNPTGDVRPQERPIAEFVEDQVWEKNDDVNKAQQQYVVLEEKVRIAVASEGDFAKATLSANPWRTRPEGSDIRPGDRGDLGPLKEQPEKSARKGVPTLAERTRAWEKREARAAQRNINPNQETNWAHEPALRGDDYRVEGISLGLEEKLARRKKKEEVNIRDGLTPDGKTLAAGSTSAARRRNQEVAIDRNATHQNSVSEILGDKQTQGTDPFEGLDESSNPQRPRRPRSDTGIE